jgi:hypothetical protein
MTQASLQRLIITFKPEELVMHALYRTQEDSPNPGTKARTRAVVNLTRQGLRQALASLEGAECVGTSGFTTREDILSLPRPDEPTAARRAAS